MVAYLGLIFNQLGLITFALIALGTVIFFLQKVIIDKTQDLNSKRLTLADKRGKRINEILSGVKIIKLKAWEKVMYKIASKLRLKEANLLFQQRAMDCFSGDMPEGTGILFGLVGFSLFSFLHNGRMLDLGQAYELVTLFHTILTPVTYMIFAIKLRAETITSCERLERLMWLDQFEAMEDNPSLTLGSLSIQNGCFNWESPKYYKIFEGQNIKEQTKSNHILKEINLRVEPGDFIAVIGQVSSGKTSLLLALMNEMVKQKGEVNKNGDVAYIPQEAFLQNDTLENNIVYGKEYSSEKFNSTIELCQMAPDLEILPGKEKTEIGERGLNLSGGQKQRISIARAVYSDSDIYLIDDALSALDAYVGKKIMNDVFLGRLSNKTRVMVTNYLHMLDGVERVILMEQGSIVADGPFESVKKTEAYKRFIKAKKTQDEDEGQEDNDQKVASHNMKDSLPQTENQDSNQSSPLKGVEGPNQVTKSNQVEKIIELTILKTEKDAGQLNTEGNTSATMTGSENKNSISEVGERESQNIRQEQGEGKLTVFESRDTGISTFKPYVFYFSKAGPGVSILTNLFCVLSVIMDLLVEWWVGRWALDQYNMPSSTYRSIYVIGVIITILVFFSKSLFFARMASNASFKFFTQILWNLLRRPMAFFDATPTGVIINRCTNDMDQVDTFIPWMMGMFINTCYEFMFTFALAAIGSPLVIVVIAICAWSLLNSFYRFLKTTIEIKRLAQVSLAPLISISSEFIDGAAVVRCYKRRDDMLKRYEEKADLHHSCCLHDDALFSWIRIRVVGGIVLSIIVVLFSVVLNIEYRYRKN